ncbi:MAG: hypothetical protein ACR2MK_11715 [Solirubrobacteraceae bacterium]
MHATRARSRADRACWAAVPASLLAALVALALVALVLSASAPGRSAPTLAVKAPCSGDYARGPVTAARTLRFGIDPELAGSAGSTQNQAKPVNEAKTLRALQALRPPGKELVLRVSRLFESDGEAGIRRWERVIDRYTRAGFDTELQVRYHPSARQRGDIAAWTRYVRRVVDAFGPNRRLLAMTITNEVNIAFSPNTSDGGTPRAEQALVKGIIAAHQEAVRRGFGRLRFGFTFAYRFNPITDAAVFRGLRSGGEAFRRALGFVGVDYYPELYPGLHVGIGVPTATGQMLATMRRCFMRLGGLGASVPLWITESGYDTTPGQITATQQRIALGQILKAIRGGAKTYGVTDYRWFNLRDNASLSTNLFATTGLLTDGYARKPSFAAYRSLIARFGVPAPELARARTSAPVSSRPSSRMSARRPPRWTSSRRTGRDA